MNGCGGRTTNQNEKYQCQNFFFTIPQGKNSISCNTKIQMEMNCLPVVNAKKWNTFDQYKFSSFIETKYSNRNDV